MTAPCLSCDRPLLPGQGITVGADRFCDLDCWEAHDPDEVDTARQQWTEETPVNDATDLRARIVKALNTASKEPIRDKHDRHDGHTYDMYCYVCKGDVEKLADAVLGVVAEVQAERDELRRMLAATAQQADDAHETAVGLALHLADEPADEPAGEATA